MDLCHNCKDLETFNVKSKNIFCEECKKKGFKFDPDKKSLLTPKHPTEGVCTYSITGSSATQQWVYGCKICSLNNDINKHPICIYCAYECKKLNHNIRIMYGNAYCENKNKQRINDLPRVPTPGNCTFNITEENPYIQEWYNCNHCFGEDKKMGVCVYCAYTCEQEGHELIKRCGPFFCNKRNKEYIYKLPNKIITTSISSFNSEKENLKETIKQKQKLLMKCEQQLIELRNICSNLQKVHEQNLKSAQNNFKITKDTLKNYNIVCSNEDFKKIIQQKSKEYASKIDELNKIINFINEIKIPELTSRSIYCKICIEKRDYVYVSKCGHAICDDCFNTIYDSGDKKCPNCRIEFTKPLQIVYM
jgi:hypothetical protein